MFKKPEDLRHTSCAIKNRFNGSQWPLAKGVKRRLSQRRKKHLGVHLVFRYYYSLCKFHVIKGLRFITLWLFETVSLFFSPFIVVLAVIILLPTSRWILGAHAHSYLHSILSVVHFLVRNVKCVHSSVCIFNPLMCWSNVYFSKLIQ